MLHCTAVCKLYVGASYALRGGAHAPIVVDSCFMPIASHLETQLSKLAERTPLRVLGLDLLKNDAEARLCLAVLQAYGDADRGFLYVTPTLAKAQRRPPDLVLGHPCLGLLIFEAKGHKLDEIEGIEAGYLHVRYHNQVKPTNVIRQSEDQLFEIQTAIGRLLPNRRNPPLINAFIAFPNITLADWQARRYHEIHPLDVLLFAEHLAEPALLRDHINALVSQTQALARKARPLDEEHWQPMAMVFGNSDVINSPDAVVRPEIDEQSLGAHIDEVQAADKHLSDEQKELIELRVGGFPRVIRGVAGSGKTVVLAKLAARYLHRHYPEQTPRIAATCFNRTLVPFLTQKLDTAWREYGHEEVWPADALRLTHLNRLMWLLIEEAKPALKYISPNIVKDGAKRAELYRKQIAQIAKAQPARYQALCFDAIFVDEAQDFAPEEFALLLDLLKPHPDTGEKTLILCYDDAQNLYGLPRPVWRDLGINVAVGDRSRVMRHCFRNSRQTVELAFNVLIGTQAPPDLRVHTRQYADVAYLREHNLISEEAACVRVHFAKRDDALPVVQTFSIRHEELNWVVDQLVHLVQEEAVRPEDILLLTPKPSAPELDLDYFDKQVRARLPQVPLYYASSQGNKDQHLFTPNQMTFSTVFGAKGYDAPVVFVVGADLFPYTKEGRAEFYVAATRAKLRLYISGVWRDRSLLGEAGAMRARL